MCTSQFARKVYDGRYAHVSVKRMQLSTALWGYHWKKQGTKIEQWITVAINGNQWHIENRKKTHEKKKPMEAKKAKKAQPVHQGDIPSASSPVNSPKPSLPQNSITQHSDARTLPVLKSAEAHILTCPSLRQWWPGVGGQPGLTKRQNVSLQSHYRVCRSKVVCKDRTTWWAMMLFGVLTSRAAMSRETCGKFTEALKIIEASSGCWI